jgi:ectoine hydroxylase-related dioxygenase (phytanoyl-CoA dioxygenase family)
VITAEQVAHYKTFGFLALREAFNLDEVAAFGQAFDELLERDRQGLPFSGEKRQTLFGIAEQHPLLTQLVEDDRIYQTVEQLLGPGFSWLCSEGNLYIGDTPWHPDGGSNSDFPFMKVSLYLDPLAWDTGCLRVIPGSHRLPFHQELRNLTDRQGEVDTAAAKIDIAGPEVPCFPLPAQPGDVFFLDMNMWHASFGGKAGRRHLALNFTPEPTEAEHVAMLERDYHGVLRLMERFQCSRPGRVFSDAFLHSESPRIRHLVSKWVELGLQ